MNYIAACIIYHSSASVTLGLMSHLIEDYQLCDVFAENLVGVNTHNQNLVKLTEKHLPELDKHLKEFGISLEIFSTQWIIDLFSHIIPIEDYMLFLDSFFQKGFDFFYRLVLTILDMMTPEVLELWDWSDILEGIKEKITQVKWKKAISMAQYNFNKLF